MVKRLGSIARGMSVDQESETESVKASVVELHLQAEE